jgi:hypothetical protein
VRLAGIFSADTLQLGGVEGVTSRAADALVGTAVPVGVLSASQAGLSSGIPVVGGITADALVGTVEVGPASRANTGVLSSIISQAWRAADALKFLSIPNARSVA